MRDRVRALMQSNAARSCSTFAYAALTHYMACARAHPVQHRFANVSYSSALSDMLARCWKQEHLNLHTRWIQIDWQAEQPLQARKESHLTNHDFGCVEHQLLHI